MTSTVQDRHAATTVLDLVPAELARGARLYPVGRLDQDSEGLILLTNDGDWAEHVLHPRYGVEREYAVALARPLTREQAEALEAGVELTEGVATVTGLRGQTNTEDRRSRSSSSPPPDPRLTWVRVTIHQGWKRQLRRMFGEVGAPVRRLVRVRIGSLRLGDLATGDVRPLTARTAATVAGRDRVARRPSRAAWMTQRRAAAQRACPIGRRRPLAADWLDPVPRLIARTACDPGRYPRAMAAPARRRDPAPRREARRRARIVVALDGPASSGKSSVGAAAAGAPRAAVRRHRPAVPRPDRAGAARGRRDRRRRRPRRRSPTGSRSATTAPGRLTRVLLDGADTTDEPRAARGRRRGVGRVARRPRSGPRCCRASARSPTAAGSSSRAATSARSCCPDADLKLFLDASVEERAAAADRRARPGSRRATRPRPSASSSASATTRTATGRSPRCARRTTP